MNQVVYVSATPGPYELTKSGGVVVEQVIRPTGLVDPQVEIRPVKGQVDDLLEEIRKRAERNERVLVTTLTKRMAEDLSEYFAEIGVRCRYLHSEVETLDRINICAICDAANSTFSSASIFCAKVWICRKCRWWPSWMPTRKAICEARLR